MKKIFTPFYQLSELRERMLYHDYSEYMKTFMPNQAYTIFWINAVVIIYSAVAYMFFKGTFLLSAANGKAEYACLFFISAVFLGLSYFGIQSKKLSEDYKKWLSYFEFLTNAVSISYISWGLMILHFSITDGNTANFTVSLIVFSVCITLLCYKPLWSGIVLGYWILGTIGILHFDHEYNPKTENILSAVVFGVVLVIMYSVKYFSGVKMNNARLVTQKTINEYNARLEDEVKKKTEKIELINDTLIFAMADMVESRDLNTGGHIKRTSEVVRILANEMQKSPEYSSMEDFFSRVVKAAPMHDLGKIAVDDVILRKPGKFTAEEFNMMKSHSEKGAGIVEKILADFDDEEFRKIAVNVAHYHHERLDGSGYPMKLSGNSIPFEARIMAVADVYDALVSKRCYKDRFSFEDAKNIILEGMGTQFDPKLKPYFEAVRPELEAFYTQAFADEKQ